MQKSFKKFLSVLFPLATFLINVTTAQEYLDVKYDSKTKSIVKDGTKGININKSYQLRFTNTNNGYFITSVKSDTYLQISNAPDILKFLSVTSTGDFNIAPVTALGVTKSQLTGAGIEAQIDTQIKELKNLESFLKDCQVLSNKKIGDWKKGVNNIVTVAEADKVLTDSALPTTNKSDAIAYVRQVLQQPQILNDLIRTFLKNPGPTGAEATTLIPKYSEFMSRIETATVNATKYSQAINFIFDCKKFKDVWGTGPIDEDKAYFDVFTANVKNDGDLVAIKVVVTDKLTKDTVTTQNLTYYTYGRWRFDFSTGFYYSPIVYDSWSVTSTNTDNSTITYGRDNTRTTDIAIGGQLHFGYKVARSVSAGVNLGSALSTYDASLRYMGGFHVMLGQSKQIVLSGGWALAKMKRLSDAQNIADWPDKDHLVVSTLYKDLKLIDRYDLTSFIGISYNLGGFKKNK